MCRFGKDRRFFQDLLSPLDYHTQGYSFQKREANMDSKQGYIRHGMGAARPYVYGNLDLPAFLTQTFGAVELERAATSANGAHVEMQIDDSIVVLETGEWPTDDAPKPVSIYVYVPDVDVAYQRALACGATGVGEPEEKLYGERGAGVRDSFGNTWWIATYKSEIPQ